MYRLADLAYYLPRIDPWILSRIADERTRRPKGTPEGGEFAPEPRGSIKTSTPRAALATPTTTRQIVEFLLDFEQQMTDEMGHPPRGIAPFDKVNGDSDQRTALRMIGYNNPPTLLPTEQFDVFEGQPITVGTYDTGRGFMAPLTGRETRTVFWRSVRPRPDAFDANEIIRRTAEDPPDKMYMGYGIFGNGTFIGNEASATQFGADEILENDHTGIKDDFGVETGVMKFKIKPGTRLIGWDDIPVEIRSGPRWQLAVWVALSGYHGINATETGDFMGGINILDRSRLVMEYNKPARNRSSHIEEYSQTTLASAGAWSADDLIRAYTVFGIDPLDGVEEFGFRFPRLSVSFLREKAERQLRDALGRWRKMRGILNTGGSEGRGVSLSAVADAVSPGFPASRPAHVELPDALVLHGPEASQAMFSAGLNRTVADRYARGLVVTRDRRSFVVLPSLTEKDLEAMEFYEKLEEYGEKTKIKIEESKTDQDKEYHAINLERINKALSDKKTEYEEAKARKNKIRTLEKRFGVEGMYKEVDPNGVEMAAVASKYLEEAVAKLPKWMLTSEAGEKKAFVAVLSETEEFESKSREGRKVAGYTNLGSDVMFVNKETFWSTMTRAAEHAEIFGEEVINHELGHMVDFPLPDRRGSGSGRNLFLWGILQNGGNLTEYAQTDAKESFAEAFANWMKGERTPETKFYAALFGWDSDTRPYNYPIENYDFTNKFVGNRGAKSTFQDLIDYVIDSDPDGDRGFLEERIDRLSGSEDPFERYIAERAEQALLGLRSTAPGTTPAERFAKREQQVTALTDLIAYDGKQYDRHLRLATGTRSPGPQAMDADETAARIPLALTSDDPVLRATAARALAYGKIQDSDLDMLAVLMGTDPVPRPSEATLRGRKRLIEGVDQEWGSLGDVTDDDMAVINALGRMRRRYPLETLQRLFPDIDQYINRFMQEQGIDSLVSMKPGDRSSLTKKAIIMAGLLDQFVGHG